MTVALTASERRAALQTMARNPSPGADPGFAASFGAAWDEMRGFHNTTAEFQNRMQVIDRYLLEYEEKTGEPLRITPHPMILLGGDATARAEAFKTVRTKFAEAGLSFPDDAGLTEEYLKEARIARESAEGVRQRATGWGSFAGDLAGSMAGAMSDPVNQSALAFGASWSSGILRTALIEMGIAGGSQAAIEAATWGYKRQVDPEWGIGAAGLNVAFTAGAGAVLGGGIKAVAAGWRAARTRLQGQGESPATFAPPPALVDPAAPETTPRPPVSLRERVNVETPPAAGMIRFYHGGSDQSGSGSRWFSTNRSYAEGYSSDGTVGYVDLPENHPLIDHFNIDEFNNLRRTTANIELPAEIAETRTIVSGRPTEPVQQSFGRDILDAGNVVEREAETVASNPHRGAGLAGEEAHRARVQEADAAIAGNRPVEIPEDDLSLGTWRPGRVATADGRRVAVRYEVVEADELVPSHRDDLSVNPDYPANLQPRDRTRAASADQVQSMAARLDPERLGPSPDAASGAPIVGPDGVVESGNARTLAIRRAYQNGTGEEYRGFLRSLGFDVDGMTNPVLVARRVETMTDADRADFTIAANRATAARMSAAEQAVADSRILNERVMSLLRDPDVSLASNRDFRRAFVESLPESERGGLVDKRGAISKEGLARIEAAMLARAYGDATLLARMLEDTENNIKAIGGALSDVAGAWARLRDAVASGAVEAPMDITEDLLAALRIVMRARDEGKKVFEVANQTDFFERPSPITRALLGFMFRSDDLSKPTGRPAMAAMLEGYADEAAKNTAGPRLLGDNLTADEILSGQLAKARRSDLAQAAREATTPEAVDLALAKPEAMDDAALVEAQRIIAANEASEIKMTDPETGAAVTRSVDDLFAEADADMAAARDLEACATGGIIGATAA